MTIRTTFVSRDNFQKNLSAGIDNFEQLYSKSKLILNENLYPMEKTSYHFIGQMLKRTRKRNRVEKAIASQVFNAIYRAEVTSAGSSAIALAFAIEFGKELAKNNDLTKFNETNLVQEYNEFFEHFRQVVSSRAAIATEEDIKAIISKSCDKQILADVIWEAVQIAGLEGKVFVENGRQENFVIELKEGYTFHLNPFKWMLNNGVWERRECKVMIVDGLIEKVSEIDHLLTKAFETKQPMAIFAMGFSEEVGMTLRTNYDRGLLDVQPIRIPTDLESLNTANDLAVVCGCLPISSMKGDMVVFTKWEELPTVEKIRLSETQTVIENFKTRQAVSDQIRALLEKRYENNLYEDIQNLIDKRMKTLVSNAVCIFLPEVTTIENDSMRIQIDIALRQSKTILNYGTVLFAECIKDVKPQTSLQKIIYKALQQVSLEDDRVPTLSVLIGCMLAGKAMLTLYTASGFVSIEE